MRLRPLRTEHRSALIDFLKRDEENHAFFYTYLPWFAKRPTIQYWGLFRRESLVGVACLSPNHNCVSTLVPELATRFASLLRQHPADYLVGDLPTVDVLRPHYPHQDFELNALCRLEHFDPGYQPSLAERATLWDLPELIRFYEPLDFFVDSARRLPDLLRHGTVYIVRQDHRIVSACLTSTETEHYGLINEVYTHPDYRGRGYSTDCIRALCRDLVSRRKRVYLYYDVSETHLGPFYARLGFVKTRDWLFLVADPSHAKGRAS